MNHSNCKAQKKRDELQPQKVMDSMGILLSDLRSGMGWVALPIHIVPLLSQHLIISRSKFRQTFLQHIGNNLIHSPIKEINLHLIKEKGDGAFDNSVIKQNFHELGLCPNSKLIDTT